MATSVGGMDAEKQKIYEDIINTLVSIFGSHPGYRPVHSKGVVCDGAFTPTADASSFSRAPHFQRDPVPVTVRFSDFAGVPAVSDNDPNSSPRGLGLKFHLPNRTDTDIVAHSYNGFPVATVEDFLALLKALASSGPNAAKPTPLETFIASRPQAKLFMAPKPVPASFATESYYGADAFRFVNQRGEVRLGRYRIHPIDGERYLDAAAVAASSANFLFDELAARLAHGAARFRLFLQIPKDSDRTSDATIVWPNDRPQLELGALAVTKIAADSDAAQRRLLFDPARLVDGIELSDDTLPLARSAVYAISYARRNK